MIFKNLNLERKDPEIDLCSQSPCGPYSQCHVVNKHIKCSCMPNCIGSPPYCRLECITDADCPLNKACDRNKCFDPCIGSCASNALCRVVNHSPICTCPAHYTGDPFVHCEIESMFLFSLKNIF